MLPLAITPGEPAGIGPDIVLKLAQYGLSIPLVVIADRDLLTERAEMLGLKLSPHLIIHHVPLKKSCTIGNPNPDNAEYILETLQIAAEGCQSNDYHAMVTGPVNKASINEAGIPFSGHTEWLAKLTGVTQTVMLFVKDQLKVALYSTHIPLNRVAESLNQLKLQQCLQILNTELQKYFLLKKPRILVCGLNPHAGEYGHLGTEEITIIQPAIDDLKQQGLSLTGPVPADTAFTQQSINNYDAILTMYHDQGLPVVKALGFGQAINVTLGLPFIRTSVDHGTACDIAGTGLANERSLLAAINLAAKINR